MLPELNVNSAKNMRAEAFLNDSIRFDVMITSQLSKANQKAIKRTKARMKKITSIYINAVCIYTTTQRKKAHQQFWTKFPFAKARADRVSYKKSDHFSHIYLEQLDCS